MPAMPSALVSGRGERKHLLGGMIGMVALEVGVGHVVGLSKRGGVVHPLKVSHGLPLPADLVLIPQN